MAFRTHATSSELDGLRLLALSRIPRCGSCPRFASLVEAHDGGRAREIGAVPGGCTYQVCAPLVARFRPAGGRLLARPHDRAPAVPGLVRVGAVSPR